MNPKKDLLLMANILASRRAEWPLLQANHERIKPRLSSLAVDLWDGRATPGKVMRRHRAIIDRFDQVAFTKLGQRRNVAKHLRSSLTYYRHWLSTLAVDYDEELPAYVMQLDARYQDAIDLDIAAEYLERPEVVAVTCYQQRGGASDEQIRRFAQSEAMMQRLPHEILERDENGYFVRGPWFSTRYFVIKRSLRRRFVAHVEAWRTQSSERMEYYLCQMLGEGERIFVHDPA